MSPSFCVHFVAKAVYAQSVEQKPFVIAAGLLLGNYLILCSTKKYKNEDSGDNDNNKNKNNNNTHKKVSGKGGSEICKICYRKTENLEILEATTQCPLVLLVYLSYIDGRVLGIG
jgi:hypothetical protein